MIRKSAMARHAANSGCVIPLNERSDTPTLVSLPIQAPTSHTLQTMPFPGPRMPTTSRIVSYRPAAPAVFTQVSLSDGSQDPRAFCKGQGGPPRTPRASVQGLAGVHTLERPRSGRQVCRTPLSLRLARR